MATLKCGDVALPEPTELTSSDEIIWSSSTGRVSSGKMVGDVVAEKKNLTIKWEFLNEVQVALIKGVLQPGFNPLTFRDDGVDITIQQYRGSLAKEHIGKLSDGIYYYRSVSVSLIEQ